MRISHALFDLGVVFVTPKSAFKSGYIQAYLLGVDFQKRRAKRVLVLEEHIMHRPEFVLIIRCKCRARRDKSVRMNIGQGKRAKHVKQIGAVFGLQFFDS